MNKKLREKLPGGEFRDVAAVDSKRMAAVRGKGNKTTERRFRSCLVRAGIRGWKVHPKGLPGNPDLFFPEQRVAVFLDGCFWHGCPDCGRLPSKNHAFWRAKIELNRERDARKALALVEAGYAVVRFWEHDLLASPKECVGRLVEALGKGG
jgi:DNA mismatch endonuclease (patch repair protein)